MIGIQAIAHYIPDGREENNAIIAGFEIDSAFLRGKIGVARRAVMADGESTSSMATNAIVALQGKTGLDLSTVQALLVITQNPDTRIPHVSARVHGLLGLDDACACFDVSLACSGYVYGLSIIRGFMQANGLTTGILVTADPYSQIIDRTDRNTALIFGDGASATLLQGGGTFEFGPAVFGTQGKEGNAIELKDGVFAMNGRAVFNFAVTVVPRSVKQLMDKATIGIGDVDYFVLHQGSKYIVDSIARKLGIPPEKTPFGIHDYGNTVSSSIPIILEGLLDSGQGEVFVLSGFGVGLSWATCVLKRKK